jgi:hypothetical protein
MPRPKAHLSHAELAMLDALIVFAQQKGYALDDDDDDTRADPPSGAAEVSDARHDGIFRLMDEYDRAVTARVRQIASTLDGPSTLRQLIELRGQAVRPS